MSLLPPRVVPILTEVLEMSDWPASAVEEAPLQAELAVVLDEEILQAITRVVDAAVDDFRAQLLPRVEAAVRQALVARKP